MTVGHAVAARGNGRRTLLLALAAGGILLVAVLVATLVVALSRSGPAPARLEPVGASTPNPFGPDATVGSTDLSPVALTAADTAARSLAVEPTIGSRVASGTTPGLYGGTGSDTCDTGLLADHLAGDPAQAAAWAGVLGTTAEAIPRYLATLSPLLLAHDTVVTNHDYLGGVAVPLQSVLQAGTAVLVDPLGVPRVRCACGNPLAPALTQPLGDPPSTPPWPGYDPDATVAVAPADAAATDLQVIDATTGQTSSRPVGPTPGDPCDGAGTSCRTVGLADVDGDGTPDPVGVETGPPAELYTGPVVVRVALRREVLTWRGTAGGMYVRGTADPSLAAWRGAFELTGDAGAELVVFLEAGQGASSRFAVLSEQGGQLLALPAPPQRFPATAEGVWTFAGDEGTSQYLRCRGSGPDRTIGHVTQQSGGAAGGGVATGASYDARWDDGSWRSLGTTALAFEAASVDGAENPVRCDRVDTPVPGAATSSSTAPTPTTTSRPPLTTGAQPATTTTPAGSASGVDDRFFLAWNRHGAGIQLDRDGTGTFRVNSGAANGRTTDVRWTPRGDGLDVTVIGTTSTYGDSPPGIPTGSRFVLTIARAEVTVLQMVGDGSAGVDGTLVYCSSVLGYASGCGA